MSQVQLPQAIMSTDVEVLVEGIILAALRGVRVFVTAGIKEAFSELFKELGIELKEYTGTLPDTCVVIREQHMQRIIIEVYDGGKRMNVVSTTPKRFAKVLETYLKKRKGDVQQLYFEMIIPKDFAKLLESIEHKEEGEDEG